MKVLMINGSPRREGNTGVALTEMEKVFSSEGIETEILQVGNCSIRGCIACGVCKDRGRCEMCIRDRSRWTRYCASREISFVLTRMI